MIEINLLPGGARKKAASGGASLNMGAMLAGLNERMGDKVLIGSVAVMLIAAAAGGYLYYRQTHDRTVAEARLEKALEDSTRFAKVVAARNIAEAKRDTLLRQVNLIRAIDDERFIWPHIMDEVSRALPAYTWLISLTYGGAPAGAVNVVASPPAPKPKPSDTTGGVRKVPALPTTIPRDAITLRLSGRTVDIQAMTQFMQDLENSPFFAGVFNERTTPAGDRSQGDFFNFQLTMQYTRPDSSAVRRGPLVASGR
jgi:Tfp pilus assembly protein PilN